MFSSLERINAAVSQAYRHLCLNGDAQLRFSREPVTLFHSGVLLYAKPDRSQWREGKGLSGGQQVVCRPTPTDFPKTPSMLGPCKPLISHRPQFRRFWVWH